MCLLIPGPIKIFEHCHKKIWLFLRIPKTELGEEECVLYPYFSNSMASPSPSSKRQNPNYMGQNGLQTATGSFVGKTLSIHDPSFWNKGTTLSLSGLGVQAEAPLGWHLRVSSYASINIFLSCAPSHVFLQVKSPWWGPGVPNARLLNLNPFAEARLWSPCKRVSGLR